MREADARSRDTYAENLRVAWHRLGFRNGRASTVSGSCPGNRSRDSHLSQSIESNSVHNVINKSNTVLSSHHRYMAGYAAHVEGQVDLGATAEDCQCMLGQYTKSSKRHAAERREWGLLLAGVDAEQMARLNGTTLRRELRLRLAAGSLSREVAGQIAAMLKGEDATVWGWGCGAPE